MLSKLKSKAKISMLKLTKLILKILKAPQRKSKKADVRKRNKLTHKPRLNKS